MKYWLVGLILGLTSVTTQAKESCTLSKTFLTAAKNNKCFDQLIADTKNPEDRKWLLDMKGKWNPPQNLNVQPMLGGYNFYDGKKFIGGFQWMSMNPAILFTNGEIKISQKPAQSLSQTVRDLFHNKSTSAYFYQSFIPTADAQEEKLDESYITLFSFWDRDKGLTPKEVLSQGWSNNSDYMPSGEYRKFWWNKNLTYNCTSKGIESIEYEVDYGNRDSRYYSPKLKKFTIAQKSKNEFVVTRPGTDRKTLAVYKPSTKGTPCTGRVSFANSEELCNKAWREFFSKNADLHRKFKLSMQQKPNCYISHYSNSEVKKCVDFFNEKFEVYASSRDGEYHVTYLSCDNADCSKTRTFPETRVDDYVAFMKSKGYSINCEYLKKDAHSGYLHHCDFPDEAKLKLSEKERVEAIKLFEKTNEYTKDETELHSLAQYTGDNNGNLNKAIQGTAILGECCRDNECRQLAKDQRGVILNPTPEQKTTK